MRWSVQVDESFVLKKKKKNSSKSRNVRKSFLERLIISNRAQRTQASYCVATQEVDKFNKFLISV